MTKRECQVIDLMVKNLYFGEIAEILNTSLTVISAHLSQHMTKLQVIDRKKLKIYY